MVATPAFAEKIKACEFKKKINSLIESADSGYALLYGVYTFLYQVTIIDTNEKFSLCAGVRGICVCVCFIHYLPKLVRYKCMVGSVFVVTPNNDITVYKCQSSVEYKQQRHSGSL